MEVLALSPALGVEIRGLDLREALDESTIAELTKLFQRNHLLLFRDQKISGADQVRVVGHFGRLLDESRDRSGYTFVSNVRADGAIREGALLFHSDLAFTDHPLNGISLYALEVPADGAPTRWANAARAARRLPETLRRALAGRDAIHVFDLRDSRGDRRFRVADLPPTAPRAQHPVLFANPDTGEESLFISEMQTDAIVGLDADESECILTELFAVLYDEGNIYEHRWHVGDLAVWDNFALQHGRGVPPNDQPRTLRRVPLGERGVTLYAS
jgi:taurine dioxygenase